MALASSVLRFVALPVGLSTGFALSAVQDVPLPARAPRETFTLAVEYRTPTKSEVPLPSATENVVVYTVPKDKRLTICSYLLPLGVPEKSGSPLAPLGLGLLVDDRTTVPKTVRFASDFELIRVAPGIEFPGGSRIVARFSDTVKGLTGSLFVNGYLE